MDLLKELDIDDSLLVVGDDVFVLNTCEGVAIFEVAVSVLSESFVAPHPCSGEVMSISRAVVGRLVVRREEPRQGGPGSNALRGKVVEPQEWHFAHHNEEVSRHVVFIAPGGACYDVVHL
jgi:hypothetical protein